MGFYATDLLIDTPTARKKETAKGPHFRGATSGFRFYSPQLGRWLSRDPMGEPSFHGVLGARGRAMPRSDANPHLFARGNPIDLIDPLGLEVQPPADFHFPHEDEGEDCCCGPTPCSVTFDAEVTGNGLKIQVAPSVSSEGCCSDLHTRSWTCSYGDQQCWDTPLNDWFWPVVQGDYVYVHVYVSYLACDGNPGEWAWDYDSVTAICTRSLLGGWSCD